MSIEVPHALSFMTCSSALRYSATSLAPVRLRAHLRKGLAAAALNQRRSLASEKLKLYFHDEKHPALAFWKDVNALDPRRAAGYVKNHEIPQSLHRFLECRVPLAEIIKYEALAQSSQLPSSSELAFQFWHSYKHEMPNLSKLALTALCVPASSASVERSFSQLKRVYTATRTSLTEENLETLF